MRQCLLVTNRDSLPLDGSWCSHNLQAYFGAANPFSALIISQAGKWAISPLPLPLFVAHLLGRNGRGKGGGASFDRCSFVSLLRSSICCFFVFFFFSAGIGATHAMGERRVCVFVGGCGQGVSATAVLQAVGAVQKFSWRCWQEGPQERVCGTGRATPVPCSGISIGLGVATATMVELCVSHRLIPHEEGHTDRCCPQAWSLFWPGNGAEGKQG